MNQRTTEHLAGIEALWAGTCGDPDICIAVLDGPVDQNHPSLTTANLTHKATLVPSSAKRGPAAQHGTHVISIIFGQHNGPITGVAPQCRGLIIPIYSDDTDDSIASCSQLDLARAIMQAIETGAHLINISGGEFTPSGTAHPILANAIQACAANNVLIVAAAGNDGCECLHIPGALPSVLAVGAMDSQGRPLAFSNWGNRYRLQGMLAPGENILGAVPGGETIAQSGTSYATPLVAGVAALLLSLQRKLGMPANPHAVRTALLESAYPCNGQIVSDCRPYLTGSLNITGARHLIVTAARAISFNRLAGDYPPKPVDRKLPASKGVQTMLQAGDVAPDFLAQDHTGREVRLSDYRGSTVVLWFYPEADTPG